jgi:hypothetical protein
MHPVWSWQNHHRVDKGQVGLVLKAREAMVDDLLRGSGREEQLSYQLGCADERPEAQEQVGL